MLFENASTIGILLAAGLSTASSVFLAIKGRSAPAGVMATFTIALMLIYNIPRLDSLKGLGLEAKVRAQVDQAASIFERINKIGTTYSALSYNTMTVSLANGTMKWSDGFKYDCSIRDMLKNLEFRDNSVELSRQYFLQTLDRQVGSTYFYAKKFVLEKNSLKDKTPDEEMYENSIGKNKITIRNIASLIRSDPNLTGLDASSVSKLVDLIDNISMSFSAAIDKCVISELAEDWSKDTSWDKGEFLKSHL